MKRLFKLNQAAWLLKLMICVFASAGFAQAQIQPPQTRSNNSISGFVFDAKTRQPVADVYVELTNEVYVTISRTKTDGGGRFIFRGMSAGTFLVKVIPYGTNYQEEIQEANIINFYAGNNPTSDSVYMDFYLKVDSRKVSANELNPAAVIFVQEIPSAAKKLYEKAVSQFDKNKDIELAFENLKKAIEIFPNYYYALNRLGVEYVRRNQYYESLPYLIKSIEINPKSFSSYFALGFAAFNLKSWKEAAEAFRGATIINPQSSQAHLRYGMMLRIDGNYKEAEKVLTKAKELAKDAPLPDIHWQLALLYNQNKRYKEAADELEIYIKLQPESSDTKQQQDLLIQLREKAKTQ